MNQTFVEFRPRNLQGNQFRDGTMQGGIPARNDDEVHIQVRKYNNPTRNAKCTESSTTAMPARLPSRHTQQDEGKDEMTLKLGLPEGRSSKQHSHSIGSSIYGCSCGNRSPIRIDSNTNSIHMVLASQMENWCQPYQTH